MIYKVNVFTNYALLILTCGIFLGFDSYTYEVGSYLSMGMMSFMIVPILDCTAYSRLMTKNRIPYVLFHVGNVLLHIVPGIFVSIFPPTKTSFLCRCFAPVFHVSWGFLFADKSLFLDTVYVHMIPKNWYILWFAAVVLEFFSCHLFQSSTKSWEHTLARLTF